jgi:hypothetical protein
MHHFYFLFCLIPISMVCRHTIPRGCGLAKCLEGEPSPSQDQEVSMIDRGGGGGGASEGRENRGGRGDNIPSRAIGRM